MDNYKLWTEKYFVKNDQNMKEATVAIFPI